MRKLYEELNHALESDPPPEVRRDLWQMARSTLQQWIMMEYVSDKVKKPSARLATASTTGSRLSFIQVWSRLITEPKGRYASMSF